MTLSEWALHGVIDGSVALAVVGVIWFVAGNRLPPRLGAWLFGLAMLKGAVPLPVELAWLPTHPMESIPMSETLPVAMEAAVKTGAESMVLAHSWTVMQVAGYAWLIGVLVGLVRLAWLCVRTRRLCASSRPWSGESWGVECRVVAGLHAPAVTGLLRPVVLLPDGLEQRLTADQMRWVIAHEVAHARAGDLVWELLTALLRVVCFFNPALWIASMQAARLRELACDEEALTLARVSRHESAQGFIALIEWAQTRPTLQLAGAGMSSAGREAGRRVKALASIPRVRMTSRNQSLLAVISFILALPGYRLVHAEAESEAARVVTLERRIAELEAQLQTKSRLERLRERATSRAHARSKADEDRYSADALREIERLYQEGKQKASRAEVAAAFTPLMEQFAESNRAGCAVLLLARLSSGAERAALLKRAVSQHSADYFLDGTNVGGVARLMLAEEATDSADIDKWRAEITASYAEELDFGAVPIADLLQPSTTKK
jgi:beta-lactamase regulating signal transducer with metallopeptidase domain